ncbi:MAG: ribonuclease BN (tRNA processing enzyme) [Lysobacterales bacterium]|jgi:ribonuclease BN (tRNA processing enzyme)
MKVTHLLIFITVWLLFESTAYSAQPENPESRTQLVLLGTGTPNADPDRFGPSLAIVVNDTPYLVDFGPGVVRRAAAAHRNGINGLEVSKLEHAFVTHLHSDHTSGYPDLILTPWVLEREAPLKVFGPKGLKDMTEHIQLAYKIDIDVRLNGLEPANTEGYKVEVTEIEPGVIFQDENVKVTAFSVPHGSWKPAFGYRFDTADKSIVVSGDTGPNEKLVEICNGCDILVHEVYSTAGFARRIPVWQNYHSSFHTSSSELADIATRAKPGLLVLFHQLYWGTSDEDLLKEVQAAYEGKVVSGVDLDVFD